MSDSGSSSRRSPRPPPGGRAASPQAALDALLAGAAGDPIRRALWLDALDRQLRPLLPPSLAAHARLANVDGARLVYLADSPVWHAKLRLAAPELLDAARSFGLPVSELVVRTTKQPLPSPARAATATAAPRSAVAGRALRDALATLSDPTPDPDRDGSR